MRKVSVAIRLLIEAVVGLICLLAFTLRFGLPLVLGYLGMPRRYHLAELHRFKAAIMLVEYLWPIMFLLTGFVCFLDVFNIIRSLRSDART